MSNIIKNNVELKSEYLSFFEVLAQSIGSIAPTASLAFVIPIVYATAGNGTWLTYIFALVVSTYAIKSAHPDKNPAVGPSPFII